MILLRLIIAALLAPVLAIGALSTADAMRGVQSPAPAAQAATDAVPMPRWSEQPVVFAGLRGCTAARIRAAASRGDDIESIAVRSGPGDAYPSVDTVRPGESVAVCQDTNARGEAINGWSGIVYGRPLDLCELVSEGAQARAYAGPCRSGWIEDRDLRPVQLYAGGGE